MKRYDSLRASWLIVRLSFRADPLRAAWLVVRSPISMCTVIGSAIGLMTLTDAALNRDLSGVTGAVQLLVAVQLLGIVASTASLAGRAMVIEKTSLLIDKQLMESALGVPGLTHHETPKYRDQLELIRLRRGELGEVIDAVSHNLGIVLLAGGSLVLLGGIHPLLVLLPLASLLSLWASPRAERWRVRAQEESAEAVRGSNHAFELATGAAASKEIRLFGLGPSLVDRHRRLWDEADRVQDRAILRGGLLGTLAWQLANLGFAASLILIVYLAATGQASPGDVVGGMRIAAGANQLVQGIVFMAGWLFGQMKTAARVVWLMDFARSNRFDRSDAVDVPESLRRGISLDNVSFRYPGTDVDVLSQVSIDLPAGATVALVGENGAGKSTVVKVLARFYEPTEGRVLVDGVDSARLDPVAWRSRMAAGFQDFARLELLAGETVGVGDLPRMSQPSAVEAALERAAATDVLPALPDGAKTPLGRTYDDGAELSGGQWQKLALGRAMMRETPLVLLLDEPTASLDPMTENALFERFARGAARVSARTGAITVLVSHRFSTVRMADLIVVLDGGRVVEAGSHDELIVRDGIYAELYELQARAYR